jgi:Protein of unknown function (DUF3568)
MKTMIFAVMLGAALAGAGCVSTVNERTAAGFPFIKDRVEGRYARSVDQVFNAARDVVKRNGVLVRDSNVYSTNVVRTLEGRVNQCNVWMRVEPVDPRITQVVVQTRTQGGGANLDLAHELEKEIALELK